jgi:hypothetical protein
MALAQPVDEAKLVGDVGESPVEQDGEELSSSMYSATFLHDSGIEILNRPGFSGDSFV